ncbi:MAG: hypothetical protein PHH37_11460 [Paludibacter sp.]|nr:hypothetical protein [Paludibacter sp.]
MNRDNILLFAFNQKPSNKGLVFYCQIDEFDKVKITPKGLIEIDENICINIVSPNVRIPTELEINEALDLFISLNGREAFKQCE